MNRLSPLAALLTLTLATAAAATPADEPAADPAPADPAPADTGASPRELEDRRNLVLERELKEALGHTELQSREAAIPTAGFGLLAAGGAVWVASETDARGTWAVILGHLAVGALTDAVILGATPDPGARCRREFEAARSDTPETLAARVQLGERCLEADAQREASLRLARAFRNVASGAATVALWGTEAPQNRDRTLVWIALADGAFGLLELFPGPAQRRLGDFRERELDLRLAPAPAVDTAGRVAPGVGLVIHL